MRKTDRWYPRVFLAALFFLGATASYAGFGSDPRFTKNTDGRAFRKETHFNKGVVFKSTVTILGPISLASPATSFSSAPLEGDGSSGTPFTLSTCPEGQVYKISGGSWACADDDSVDPQFIADVNSSTAATSAQLLQVAIDTSSLQGLIDSLEAQDIQVALDTTSLQGLIDGLEAQDLQVALDTTTLQGLIDLNIAQLVTVAADTTTLAGLLSALELDVNASTDSLRIGVDANAAQLLQVAIDTTALAGVGGGDFSDGGDAAGKTLALGTGDANDMNFLRNGATYFKLIAGAASFTAGKSNSQAGTISRDTNLTAVGDFVRYPFNTGAARTFTLSSAECVTGRTILLYDAAGVGAGTNAITVNADGFDNIVKRDGTTGTSDSIDQNKGWRRYTCSTGIGWITVGSEDAPASIPDPLLLSNGSQAAPTYSFSGDTNTGMYNNGGDVVAFSAGNVTAAEMDGSDYFHHIEVHLGAYTGTPSVLHLTKQDDTNTGLYWPEDDSVGIAGGGAQAALFSVLGSTFAGQVSAPAIVSPAMTAGDLAVDTITLPSGHLIVNAPSASFGDSLAFAINAGDGVGAFVGVQSTWSINGIGLTDAGFTAVVGGSDIDNFFLPTSAKGSNYRTDNTMKIRNQWFDLSGSTPTFKPQWFWEQSFDAAIDSGGFLGSTTFMYLISDGDGTSADLTVPLGNIFAGSTVSVLGNSGRLDTLEAAPAGLDAASSPTISGLWSWDNQILGDPTSDSTPAYSFSDDPDTGMTRTSGATSGDIRLVADGTLALRITEAAGATTVNLSNSSSLTVFDGFQTMISGNRLRTAAGTASNPAHGFFDDTNNGMFRPTTDTLAFSSAGTERLRFTSAGNGGFDNQAPISLIQVGELGGDTTSYLHIDQLAESGAPPSADCDADAEAGRWVLGADNTLYICNGAARGWDSVSLVD